MWKKGNKEVRTAYLEYKIRTNYKDTERNQF